MLKFNSSRILLQLRPQEKPSHDCRDCISVGGKLAKELYSHDGEGFREQNGQTDNGTS